MTTLNFLTFIIAAATAAADNDDVSGDKEMIVVCSCILLHLPRETIFSSRCQR